MVTGALVAVFAIREGLRRISQQPVVLHAKAPYMLDVVAALFVAKEGLHRLGSWALRAPANTARS